MDDSFNSPKPYSSQESLTCPPTPRGRKPSVTIDKDTHMMIIPLFFPTSSSILGTNDSSAIEMNDDPYQISNRPAVDFTLIKSRHDNCEVFHTRKICTEDFPALPFSLPDPANQATTYPLSMPRSSSDPNKLRPCERRRSRSSLAHPEHRRSSFNARCA